MDSIKYIQVTYPYPPLVQIIRWSYVYFYHIQQHLRTVGRPGFLRSFSFSPRYFFAGS